MSSHVRSEVKKGPGTIGIFSLGIRNWYIAVLACENSPFAGSLFSLSIFSAETGRQV
jgi:hypothetical protein